MIDESPPPVPTAKQGVRCLSCGFDLVGVALGQMCPECGTPVLQFPAGQTSGKAVTSLILGILGLATCFSYGIIGMPCAILAIVFARQSELEVQAGNAPVSSLGLSKAGRICGWIGVALNSIGLVILGIYAMMFIMAIL